MTEEEKKAALKAGDIIRVISDAHAHGRATQFLGALCVVHEIRGWGVLAAIPVPWTDIDAIIPLRLAWDDFDLTGGKIPLTEFDEVEGSGR